jgi:tetratricopeptide (TPR) repeat protein
MGRPQEAEEALRRSLELLTKLSADTPGVGYLPNVLARGHYDLGVLLDATGRPDDAAAAFRQAFAINKELAAAASATAETRYQLGWLLSTCPAVQFRDPGRAVKLARQLLRDQPSLAKNWRLLGVAQYRAGNWSAAIQAIGRSMELRQPLKMAEVLAGVSTARDRGAARSRAGRSVRVSPP